MGHHPEALVVFVRLPILGKVKSRIAKTAGQEKALNIYRKLYFHTIEISTSLKQSVFLFYEGGLPAVSERNPHVNYLEQIEGSLDKKIYHALSYVLKNHPKAVIIGSDCPELTSSMIANSFQYLDTFDTILGPAKDGGFYLFGCKQLRRELLENISWSTSSVLKQLLFNIHQAQLSCKILDELSDIDLEEDWLSFQERKS